MQIDTTQRQLIGIVGRQGSGKDVAANYIANNYSCIHVSLSDIIREYLVENDLGKETRPLMRKSGNELRTKYGPDYLARRTLEKYPSENLIISSIRNPQELALLKQHNIFLIEIVADSKTRFDRLRSRMRDGDSITYDEFLAQEQIELSSDKEHEQQMEIIFAQADLQIENNSTLEELYAKIDEVIIKNRNSNSESQNNFKT